MTAIPPSSDAVEKAKRLLELHAKATPGPVVVERHDGDDGSINFEVWSQGKHYERHFTIYEHLDAKRGKANAELYAGAHNDLPAIAAALLAAATDNAKLRQVLQAQERADDAAREHDELVDRAASEGWINEPTGLSHIGDASKRANALLDEARGLRRALKEQL